MIQNCSPVVQALLGTLFTWGLTAAGSALVFVFSSGQRRILDGSLGFAAGVMLAASYWSLLAPAIELAEDSGDFGAFAFFPVAVGFTLGAAFVYLADLLLPLLGISEPPHAALSRSYDPRAVKEKYDPEPTYHQDYGNELSIRIGRTGLHSGKHPGTSSLPAGSAGSNRSIGDRLIASSEDVIKSIPDHSAVDSGNPPRQETAAVDLPPSSQPDRGENGEPYQRRKGAGASQSEVPSASQTSGDSALTAGSSSWRRIMLLILAVTIHNIPEGLAVGVGFGAIGKSASATFESARNLAVGIGIQNFPEGLAVSLPLRGAGFSTWRAFWYGQLSGMVEPLAGVFGAFAMVLAEPLLPYALGFAAGAMVYVVMDDIIPEAQTSGNGKLASWTSILGFVVMMSLDVGLG